MEFKSDYLPGIQNLYKLCWAYVFGLTNSSPRSLLCILITWHLYKLLINKLLGTLGYCHCVAFNFGFIVVQYSNIKSHPCWWEKEPSCRGYFSLAVGQIQQHIIILVRYLQNFGFQLVVCSRFMTIAIQPIDTFIV